MRAVTVLRRAPMLYGEPRQKNRKKPTFQKTNFSTAQGRSMSDVTRILSALEQGEPQAAARLLPLVYDALRKLVAWRMAQEKPGQTAPGLACRKPRNMGKLAVLDSCGFVAHR